MNSIKISDNELISGLDQIIPMEQAQLDILERVDTVFDRAINEGDPEIATNAMKSLVGISRISGLAMAKFCYLFKFGWDNFGLNGTYEEYLEDKIGRGKDTIVRNIRVWEMLVSGDVPLEYCNMLKLHPIGSLIPMANLHSQGFEVTDDQWRQLSNAPDVTSVNKLIREIKGKPARKGSLQLELVGGTIYAWKDGIRKTVGHLNVDDPDPIVQQAIARIMGNQILEKQ